MDGDYGPVEFRIDSSQRKNQVLIFDSRQYPGKSSEWFFARKNRNTKRETYRCATCRTVIEKANRDKSKAAGPGARIAIHENRFKVDPDFPLGGSEHICSFVTNPSCDTYMVWARRALLKANSELRQNPEKPKLKFQKLLVSIKEGKGEYAHLSGLTRDLVIEQLISNKGFDSRRRSFARNNSLAVRRLRANPETLDDAQRQSLMVFENRRRKGRIHADAAENDNNSIYMCGFRGCRGSFAMAEERAQHRAHSHPQYYFIDSPLDQAIFERTYGRVAGNRSALDGDFVENEIIVDGEFSHAANDDIGGVADAASTSADLQKAPFESAEVYANAQQEPCSSMLYNRSQLINHNQQLIGHHRMFMADVEVMLGHVHQFALEKASNMSPADRDQWRARLHAFIDSNCQMPTPSTSTKNESVYTLPSPTATTYSIPVPLHNDEKNRPTRRSVRSSRVRRQETDSVDIEVVSVDHLV